MSYYLNLLEFLILWRKRMLNEGEIKFEKSYIDKIKLKISDHVDENLIYYVIEHQLKFDLHDVLIKSHPDQYATMKRLPETVRHRILQQLFNHIFLIFLKNCREHIKNTNIPNIDWNNNPMFSVVFDVKKFSYKINWQKKYSTSFKLPLNLKTDVPSSYQKYLQQFIPSNSIEIQYIISDSVMGGHEGFSHQNVEGFIAHTTTNLPKFIVGINIAKSIFIMDANKIKNNILSIIRHELSHVLQHFGDFGKNKKMDAYYPSDIGYKVSNKSINQTYKMLNDFNRLTDADLKLIYSISILEYKASLYSLGNDYFLLYDDIESTAVNAFIHRNNSFFENIKNRYGDKFYKKAISDFYSTLTNLYNEKNN